MRQKSHLNANWAVVLGLAVAFFVFTGGMALSSTQHLSSNQTTVDAIDATKRTVFLAIRINEGIHRSPEAAAPDMDTKPSRTPLSERRNPLDVGLSNSKRRPIPWQGTITYPLYTKPGALQPPNDALSDTSVTLPGAQYSERKHPPRTFAVIQTPPGVNPWHLRPADNIKSVMGYNLLDWFLPLRLSPASNHDRADSIYPLGQTFEKLKIDAGIIGEERDRGYEERKRRRRRRKSRVSRDGSDAAEMV